MPVPVPLTAKDIEDFHNKGPLMLPKRLLTITKAEGSRNFVVDNMMAPGSPPIGVGRTLKEAIGDWVINNQDELTIHFDTTNVADTMKALVRRELARR